MDPVTMTAIAAMAPIVADLIGRALGSGDRDKAMRLLEDAAAQFGPGILDAPELKSLMPHLGASRFETARADPEAMEAQKLALREMQRMGNPDNLEFRGAMNAAELAANQQAGAQQGAIQQQMQARGMGGSGVDFAMRQQAGQNAANRASVAGFDAAKEGRRQALDAMKGAGSLAGQIRGQSWGEESDRASAADSIARFNEAGRMDAYQQDFSNRMGLARARGGAAQDMAGAYQQRAGDTQQQFSGYGQTAGAGVARVLQDKNEREAADRKATSDQARLASEQSTRALLERLLASKGGG